MVLLPIFHSDGREQGREEEPGLFYALLCSDLMEKVCFSRSIISLISRCEGIKSARRLSMLSRWGGGGGGGAGKGGGFELS